MTKKNKKSFSLRHISIHTVTITPGVNLGFAEPGIDLSALAETLAEQDGQKARILEVVDHIQTKSVGSHMLAPCFVQTAGNFAAVTNSADRLVQDLINSAVDDEFGVQVEPTMVSILAPSSQAAGTDVYSTDRTLRANQNVLNILNKEVSTEKLQSIWTGTSGVSTVNQPIYWIEFLTVIYVLTAKNIVLR
jgi:hypothetical protein